MDAQIQIDRCRQKDICTSTDRCVEPVYRAAWIDTLQTQVYTFCPSARLFLTSPGADRMLYLPHGPEEVLELLPAWESMGQQMICILCSVFRF